eukprot:12013288-Alexandrium_andersonii.AAC.1
MVTWPNAAHRMPRAAACCHAMIQFAASTCERPEQVWTSRNDTTSPHAPASGAEQVWTSLDSLG